MRDGSSVTIARLGLEFLRKCWYFPEKYLILNLNFKVRQAIACFRCSCLPLNVEKGRHVGITSTERFCEVCKSRKVEDEFHFLLECPAYQELRSMYIPEDIFIHPNLCKLQQLLRSLDESIIRKLGIFLFKACQIRKEFFCNLNVNNSV